MQKIEDIKKSTDFLPSELQNCFESIYELSKCLTIKPSSVEFLKPFIKDD